MRWTIERQFLYPVLITVMATLFGVSVATAWWYTSLRQQQNAHHLQQMVETLTAPGFPLTQSVLEKMSQLSQAEFVLLDEQLGVAAATPSLALSQEDRRRLETLIDQILRQSTPTNLRPPTSPGSNTATSTHQLQLTGGDYLAEAVATRSPRDLASQRWLVVLSPQATRWEDLRRAALPPLCIGTLGCLLIIGLIAWQSRKVTQPILRLKQQTEAIANGNFLPLPLSPRNDELRELSAAINTMVARLADYEENVRSQARLQTLAQLAGSLAHHLRNAATGSRLALELHQRACPLGEADEDLQVALRQLALIETHLQRLLTLGQTPDTAELSSRELFDLRRVVDSVVALVEPICRHRQIRLSVELPPATEPLQLLGDARDCEQLLTNLVFNAIEAVQGLDTENRQIAIRLVATSEQLELTVSDHGPGPDPSLAPRLFEPFITNKPDGAGLGLAMSRMIATAHAGELSWQRSGGTTSFCVQFPRIAASRGLGIRVTAPL